MTTDAAVWKEIVDQKREMRCENKAFYEKKKTA